MAPSLDTAKRVLPAIAIVLLAFGVAAVQAQTAPGVQPYTVVGDAIIEGLTDMPGDPVRGRAIVASRQIGMCLLCHAGPVAEERFQGNLAPDLAGAGARWSPGQLRLRVVDASRLNPQTIMPPYHRVEGLWRIAPAHAGKPLLAAQQIEDVVAYLVTLRP